MYPATAQDARGLRQIMNMLGADSPEEVDGHEYERLSHYLDHPLHINSSRLHELLSSGLFTQYQAVSLYDYIQRHGMVMSLTELSSVDGFGRKEVEKLTPFVSLETVSGKAGFAMGRKVSTDMALRFRTKLRQETPSELSGSYDYGVKYRFRYREGISLSCAASMPYAASVGIPSLYTASFEWASRKVPVRFIAGDFNARFGCGLALWNGMSMSGISSVESVSRRPGGISSSWSFTGSSQLTGFSAEYLKDGFQLTLLTALPDIKNLKKSKFSTLPAVDLTRYFRHGCVSLTNVAQVSAGRPVQLAMYKTSFSQRWCLRGVNLSSELCYEWMSHSFAAFASAVMSLSETWTFGTALRYYPSGFPVSFSSAPRAGTYCRNEYGASVIGEYASGRHDVRTAADAVYHPEARSSSSDRSIQYRIVSSWLWKISDGVGLDVRLDTRFRTWGLPLRIGTRVGTGCEWGRFSLDVRAEMLKYRKTSFLGFAEFGYRTDGFDLWLKQGAFIADHWDDRIYAYERDFPGSFNVPAFYGRGIWTTLMISADFLRKFRCFLRASVRSYLLMPVEKRKPGMAELGLYVSYSF